MKGNGAASGQRQGAKRSQRPGLRSLDQGTAEHRLGQRHAVASAFDLDKILGIPGAPQLTINVANFTNATLRSYFQFENATFNQYKPGRQFLIGLRGTF